MEDKKKFCLGGLTAGPGEKKEGELCLGGEFFLPATLIHGTRPGKTVLITAGIHAEEYVGIQAAIELAGQLKAEKTAGRIAIVKVVNRQAFEQRSGSEGFEDKKDLNRMFPGKAEGTQMERLAWYLEKELLSEADYYIDLHSGDSYEQLTPYVYFPGMAKEEVVKASMEMARQVDVPYMIRSSVSLGGCYNYAASVGIPSVLIKRGGMGAWDYEETHSTVRDVRNILCHLKVCLEERDYRKYYPLEMREVRYQSAVYGGLWYPVKNVGDMVKAGEVLGTIRDYQGKILEVCSADMEGVVLYQTGSLQVKQDGSVIAYGQISKENKDDRKERITGYWTKRSESFKEQRRNELHNVMAERWKKEILDKIGEKKGQKILDVGCGTGFFSILLAKEGHQVVGVDLTPDMIRYSRELAKEEGVSCQFQVMDAEHLQFADESFDLVISRNLTWTLPYAKKAYKEWLRVLKQDGLLLNFDANYGACDFSDTASLPKNHAHKKIGDRLSQECEEIKRQLPINSYVRPAWDVEALGQLGAGSLDVDLEISSRLYVEKDDFYNPVPMFALCVTKRRGSQI